MMNIEEIYNAIKEKTGVKSFKIKKVKEENTTIFDSKFGGMPYWDFSKEFPKNTKGEKMNLLAQINFDKEKFDDERLPQKGILQFYISSTDDIYGIDFDNQDKQSDWRVIYHEDINYKISEEDVKNQGVTTFDNATDDCYPPFDDTYKIYFEEVVDVIDSTNDSFEFIVAEILKEKFNMHIEKEKVQEYLNEIDEKYYEKFETWGHKLLGYPAFTQSDPREYGYRYKKYDCLLLQIDSDNDIMWGDSGVANFFINEEDLKNKKFDNILYNWDCC